MVGYLSGQGLQVVKYRRVCLFVCLSLGRPTGLPHIRLWMSLRDLVLEHGEAFSVTGRPAVSSRCCLITSSAFPLPIRFYQVELRIRNEWLHLFSDRQVREKTLDHLSLTDRSEKTLDSHTTYSSGPSSRSLAEWAGECFRIPLWEPQITCTE